MFAKCLAAMVLLAVSMMTPAAAWGFHPVVRKPLKFAVSQTVESAVSAITSRVYAAGTTTPSEAAINQLVAHKTKNADVVTAALSEAVGGKPRSYEAAVLSIILDAGDSSCPLIQTKENGKNKISDDNDGGRSGGGHGGEATCAAAFETCMSSCAGGPEVSLLSWRKVPEPGTCTFVCTAVQHGCTRCNNKRRLYANELDGEVAPSLSAKVQIRTQRFGESVLRVIHRVNHLLWTPIKTEYPLVVHLLGAVVLLLLLLALSGRIWEARRIAGNPARLPGQLDWAVFERSGRVAETVRGVVFDHNIAERIRTAVKEALEEQASLAEDADRRGNPGNEDGGGEGDGVDGGRNGLEDNDGVGERVGEAGDRREGGDGGRAPLGGGDDDGGGGGGGGSGGDGDDNGHQRWGVDMVVGYFLDRLPLVGASRSEELERPRAEE